MTSLIMRTVMVRMTIKIGMMNAIIRFFPIEPVVVLLLWDLLSAL